VTKTGVFARQISDENERGGSLNVTSIASTDTVIPNIDGTGCEQNTKFGSTAPPSAHGTRMVFVGSDNEDNPTCGGIYMADMADADAGLTSLIDLGVTIVPGTTDETFTRVAELLAFDGKYVAFWGTWGTDTKQVMNLCPETGNRDRRFFCKCKDENIVKQPTNETAYNETCKAWTNACYGSEEEEKKEGGGPGKIEGVFYQNTTVPTNQGIFVMKVDGKSKSKSKSKSNSKSKSTKELSRVASTTDDDGFDDFIFWHYSGAPPCAGGLEEEDDREPPRMRSSPFVAVGGNLPNVMFKASTGPVDGIYIGKDPKKLARLVDTTMKGTDFDKDAVIPESIDMGGTSVEFTNAGESLTIDEVAIEREGARGDETLHITLALGFTGTGTYDLDGVVVESDVDFAGIYYKIM